MQLGIAQILEKASKLKATDEKVNFLRNHDNVAMRWLLKMAFDKNLKWALPEGAPPYKEAEFDNLESMLYNEVKRLYIFHEGGNPNLKQVRREALFKDVLESLAPDDAKLLIGVKDKKLPYKGITSKLIDKAFPGLLVY